MATTTPLRIEPVVHERLADLDALFATNKTTCRLLLHVVPGLGQGVPRQLGSG